MLDSESAEVKVRLRTPIIAGIFGGGLLATLSCTLWLAFSPDSLELTSESPTSAADSKTEDSVLSDLKIFELDAFYDSVSNFELKATLYSLLLIKDEDDLLRFLKQSTSIESTIVRKVVQTLVFERLADIDPNMALRHVLDLPGQRRTESLEVVFQVWARSDLDAAIAAGIQLVHPLSDVALQTILLARNDLPETERRDIGLRFGDNFSVDRVIAEERSWLNTQEPEEAWNQAIEDEEQLTQRVGLLVSIAEDWWLQDSEGFLEKVVDSIKFNSDHWSSDEYVVLRLLVQALAEHSPQGIFDQAVNLDAPCKDALLYAIVQHWSRVDPSAALNTSSTYETDDRRKTLTRLAAQTWARSSPHEVLVVSSSLAKPLAEIAMEEAILSIGRVDRDESLRLLLDAQSRGFDWTNLVSTFFSDWTKEDPQATIQWILTNEEMENHERERILKVVVGSLASNDYSLALELAMSQHSDRAVFDLETTLIRTLARTDIEVAISLLPRIRPVSKLTSISLIGGTLVHTNRPQRALELGDLLTENQRLDYYTGLFHQWALYNPKQLMESISSLATNDLKTAASRALIQTHGSNPVLSFKELDNVKKYLEDN